ncbi:MAG: endopeptidase La [Clostridia bacterium]|nr:endopeptidase La [Clostridia bacterium]
MINNESNSDIENREPIRMPLLALRGLCVFPAMNLHFDVGRKKSVKALDEAMERDQRIFLVAQKDTITDKPKTEDLYEVGTIAKVKQIIKVPGDTLRVIVEGVKRARIIKIIRTEPYFEAEVDDFVPMARAVSRIRREALMRNAQNTCLDYSELAPKLPGDLMLKVIEAKTPGALADELASGTPIKLSEKQAVLEEFDEYERLKKIIFTLENEISILDVENEMREKIREQIDKNQREYYLREQMKVIQGELGEGENTYEESLEYKDKIKKLKLKKESEEHLLKEAARLMKMPYGSSESAVIRTYLDTCLELPWNKTTRERIDIKRARKILDADHYGLTKVKDRIIEFMAVRALTQDQSPQILCLVGPPGVGKTSVGRSVASAMGRKYARVSLGGVRDEADIRGHRKTYIGAMPGRIINALRQAGSKNPVVILDEIDKMSSDFRGDPASAMLEVLDGEQNVEFRDHYIELPFDLSKVMFITTANTLDTIPRPLLDRMEVIEITSYTAVEKQNIAKLHLIPKQLKKHGLSAKRLKFDQTAVSQIIESYTMEAGVRNLEREIAKVCRKAAALIVSGEKESVRVTEANLAEFLGPVKVIKEKIPKEDQVGVVNGLAWTQTGGDLLSVEVNVMDGSGKVELTGLLGDVMKESAHAAISCIRSRIALFGSIPRDFYKTKDIHIHFPEGAIPKDGPSAGITIACALISALSGCPVRRDVAMTGEITLRGRVLAIGGLKEKSMAAYKAGVKTVIIPKECEKDIAELDDEVKQNIEFVTASYIDEVINTAFAVSPFASAENNDIDLTVAHNEPRMNMAEISQ